MAVKGTKSQNAPYLRVFLYEKTSFESNKGTYLTPVRSFDMFLILIITVIIADRLSIFLQLKAEYLIV